jgi:hypothetical protein
MIMDASADNADEFLKRQSIWLRSLIYTEDSQPKTMWSVKTFFAFSAKHHARNRKPVEFTLRGPDIMGIVPLHRFLRGTLALLGSGTPYRHHTREDESRLIETLEWVRVINAGLVTRMDGDVWKAGWEGVTNTPLL